jgi:succinyl-CoA synthetase beta subunit
MKLFEHQAKELFKEAGIPIPHGEVVENEADCGRAIDKVGLPCVIKSQVLQGGRGKAGLIQMAVTKEEALLKAHDLMATRKVRKLLFEEAVNKEKEIYMAVTIDPVDCSALIMASSEGGMDIEDIAVRMPDKIIRERVKTFRSLLPFQARNVMFELGLKGEAFKQGVSILLKMFELFKKNDAELVEINPLILTADGKLVAADGKVSIDDNAAFRQKRYPITRDHFGSDIEYEAAVKGIPYLQFDGKIGLMCAGAGLTNTVYDLINYYGGSVASYLEFGGPNYRRAAEAMDFTLRNKPSVVLIVTFGTIARADVMAQGIVDAIERLKPDVPIITAIRGTGEEEAGKILRKIGLEPLSETEDAVKKAVELSKAGVR